MTKIIAFNSIEEMKTQKSSEKRRITPEQALLNTLDLMSLKSSLATANIKPKYYDRINWVDLKP